jgi:hypothetical protein
LGGVKYVQEVIWKKPHPLQGGISVANGSQSVSSGVEQVTLAVNIRSSHVVSIPLDPRSRVQPREYLLQELIGITRSDTEFSDPDGLVEGVVELLEVVLEVLGLVPGVVVGNDEVDLTVGTAVHEGLEVVDALVGFVGVGDGRRSDSQTLLGKWLDQLLVFLDGDVDGNVGTSATTDVLGVTRCLRYCHDLPDLVWLIEAEDVLDGIFLDSGVDIVSEARSAPILVAVKERNIFEVQRCTIDDGFPIIHP